MKKTKEKVDNTIINNLYKETIETTPEDGFVPDKEIRPVKMQHYGDGNTQYHKGYSKTVVFTTDDPRITRPFIKIMCGIFFVIGLVMLLLFRDIFFGLIFIATSVFTYFKANKDIDKIADELKSQGKDVSIDSIEEKEQLKKEVVGIFKDNLKDVTSATFTKERFNGFVKTSLSIYSIVVIIIVALISIFINIFLGLFLLIILVLGGLLYYYLISKLFKK